MTDHTAIDLQCFNGPETSLINYFEQRNLDKFCFSLSAGADAETLDKKVFLSVFDKVCQTPNSRDFIAACIKYGCDVNKVCETFFLKTYIKFKLVCGKYFNVLVYVIM